MQSCKVVEDLSTLTPGKFGFSQSEFNNLTAQCRVLRAWFYLRLLDGFRNVPLVTTTTGASMKQVEAIEYLKKIGKFDELDDNVKEIANLRYENPDLSIDSLSKMLQTPISKSGANHRIAKILQIAEECKRERGEI